MLHASRSHYSIHDKFDINNLSPLEPKTLKCSHSNTSSPLLTHPPPRDVPQDPPHRAFLIEVLIHPCFCILSIASIVIDGPGPITITINSPSGFCDLAAIEPARPHVSRVKSEGEARSFRSRYSSRDLKQKRRTPSGRRRWVAV